MNRGTGRPARKDLSPNLVVAGKTGTSNDYRDSWFAGFSGSHLFIVWVGHDDNSPTGLTGSTGALAAWSRLMGSIDTTSFEPLMPESLENRWIDYYTGDETSPYCSGAAVSLPFPVDAAIPASVICPPTADEGDWPMVQPWGQPTGPPVNPGEQGAIIPTPET
jgi:penicillin-binding protein 1B